MLHARPGQQSLFEAHPRVYWHWQEVLVGFDAVGATVSSKLLNRCAFDGTIDETAGWGADEGACLEGATEVVIILVGEAVGVPDFGGFITTGVALGEVVGVPDFGGFITTGAALGEAVGKPDFGGFITTGAALGEVVGVPDFGGFITTGVVLGEVVGLIVGEVDLGECETGDALGDVVGREDLGECTTGDALGEAVGKVDGFFDGAIEEGHELGFLDGDKIGFTVGDAQATEATRHKKTMDCRNMCIVCFSFNNDTVRCN